MAAQAEVDWQQRALAAEAEVARLRKRNRELGDELDLLAVANADLRAMAAPAVAPAPAPAGPPIESFAALRVHGASRALRSEPDRTIDQASGAANATCVALHSQRGLVCGGADGVLRLHIDGAEPIQHACGSPPLRLAFYRDGECLACGCMDGTVRFYNTSKLSSFDPAKNELPDMFPALDEYNRARDHTARIVSIAWGEPFGQYNDVYIATCARDKTVNIYDADDLAGSIRPLHTLVLPSNPESLCFCPGGKELIVYCRGEPFRRHIKIEGSRPVSMLAETRVSVNETRISLNANDWDTHCSFAVLSVSGVILTVIQLAISYGLDAAHHSDSHAATWPCHRMGSIWLLVQWIRPLFYGWLKVEKQSSPLGDTHSQFTAWLFRPMVSGS